MRILEINSCINGSTGKIMKVLQKYVSDKGGDCITACRLDKSKRYLANVNHIYIGNIISKHISNKLSYITGREGDFARLYTAYFLYKIKRYKPEIIHIHNLHGNYICFEMLFDYIKRNNIGVIWTLHDCWAFTGHCTHFEILKCNKWKTECNNCKSYVRYPSSRCDNSNFMFLKKRSVFNGVNNLTIVTPSVWLQRLVKQSFLGEYQVELINNGIDIDMFYKRSSHFLRESYNIRDDSIVLLGVASGWDHSKGLDVFDKLSHELSDKFKIVLVGTNETVKKSISSRIICIDRTESQDELAKIYSEADIFINPTLEDNYPTVNIEAICCGTPVFTYNTGGSGEIVKAGCGKIIEKGNYEQLKQEIELFNRDDWDTDSIIGYREFFSENRMAKAYYALYKKKLFSDNH